jgi:voltage-gated potassium channel Kch
MRRITLRDRIRYWFDNTMARGPITLIVWLFAISLALILIVSLLVWVTGVAPIEGWQGLPSIFFRSLLRTLDPGTMGSDTGSWPFLFAMLFVTLAGIFVVSTLIGVLTTGIEGQLERLRKGRSFVAESGHTVILGWTPQIFTIVQEIMTANENQGRQCIAILSEKDKIEMEDEIKARVPKIGHTHVVCRTGLPIDRADLAIVNPDGARSIIVLPFNAEAPDSQVIKTVLAVTNKLDRHKESYHIVAAIRDVKALEAAQAVMGDEVQLVLTSDLISRIAAQTCRQSGLSVVYTELMDFGGDEIYFQEEPKLVGKTFGESLLAYEDSAVIGLRFGDGRVQLNPPMDTLIGPGDKVIAVSEDDDTVSLSGKTDYGIEEGAFRILGQEDLARLRAVVPERTLILGWNQRAPALLRELDNYVGPGSEVTVVVDEDMAYGESFLRLQEPQTLTNIAVTTLHGDSTDRRLLNSLDVPSYQHVLVLSYSDTLAPQRADARTLMALLHLRNIADQHGRPFSLVSEMLDVRNRDLAEVTRADDFIVSDKLASLLLSQLSENKELAPVFEDLFNAEGSELYLKLAEHYVQLGRPVNFYTVVEVARRRSEVAIGYRLAAQAYDPERSYGVTVNPDKSNLVTFGPQDRIIVLAEN